MITNNYKNIGRDRIKEILETKKLSELDEFDKTKDSKK